MAAERKSINPPQESGGFQYPGRKKIKPPQDSDVPQPQSFSYKPELFQDNSLYYHQGHLFFRKDNVWYIRPYSPPPPAVELDPSWEESLVISRSEHDVRLPPALAKKERDDLVELLSRESITAKK